MKSLFLVEKMSTRVRKMIRMVQRENQCDKENDNPDIAIQHHINSEMEEAIAHGYMEYEPEKENTYYEIQELETHIPQEENAGQVLTEIPMEVINNQEEEFFTNSFIVDHEGILQFEGTISSSNGQIIINEDSELVDISVDNNELAKTVILDEPNIDEIISRDHPIEEPQIEPQIKKKKTGILDEPNIDEIISCDHAIEEPQIEPQLKKKKGSITKKRYISKVKRLKGKSYTGYRRDKEKVVTHDTPRNRKSIKGRCNHQLPKKITNTSFLCKSLLDEDRKQVFQTFWNLDTWNEKKLFIGGLVDNRPIRRRRKATLENNTSTLRKAEGHDYFLQNKEGKRVKVCRLFFLNTLDLGEDCLKRWVKKEVSLDELETSGSTVDNSPEIKKKQKKLTRLEIEREQLCETVREWLDVIPKVPSHYCRSSSNMIYVDNEFISKNNMYKIFCQWCAEGNKKTAYLKLFKSVLKQSKISIHRPRKDQCDTCVGFKTGNITEEQYQIHRKNKDAAREAKAKMKNCANDETLVVTMDLQSVLTCPKLLASQSYYKLKLQVHNFTIYALNDKNVTLYVWHEGSGGVSSNEFTSCLIDYLSNLPPKYTTIITISDGCNYQNRNRILSSALCDFAKENNVTIQQMYLEKGHTMMEADCVHSALEHYFYPPINSPMDYIARMRLARPNQPYKVLPLDYHFFKKYELPSNFSSIRPGKKAMDPKVVDIRQIKYNSSGEVCYTLDYSENWETLPHRRENQNMNVYNRNLFKKPPTISEDKYKHLQDLKTVIEADHHPFYDALPKESKNKKDT